MFYITVGKEQIHVTNLDEAFKEANNFRTLKPISKERQEYWNSVFFELLKHKLKSAAMKEVKLELFKDLFEEFGTIPLDEKEVLEEDFLFFEKGDNEKEEIWNWFEEVFEITLGKYFECYSIDAFQ